MATTSLDKAPVSRSGVTQAGAARRGAAKTRRRALIVGSGSIGKTLAESLEAVGTYQVVGFVDDDHLFDQQDRWPTLGGRAETEFLVAQYDIEDVFIAYAPTWQQRLAETLTAEFPAVNVRVVPTSYEALMCTGAVESYGDLAVVRMAHKARAVDGIAKRLFDVTVALLGLLLLLPVSALTALVIRATSPGPAIFWQDRVGHLGKTFRIYKFRTMRCDAERATGPVLSAGKNDARLTRIGRWLRLCRIDEIPQLWNVLRGDMSMVGPRPERVVFVNKFQKAMPSYARRHQVRPGITGLAQVCGGYHTDARDKLRFDLIYVSHKSVAMDLSILLRTLLVVCQPEPRKFEKSDVVRQ